MDDGVSVGPDEALDKTLTAMGKILLLNTSLSTVGVGDKILGRLLIKTERGFLVKPLVKLFDSLLSSAGLENCNPVHSPGVRSEMSVPGHPCCVKECDREAGNPSARDMQQISQEDSRLDIETGTLEGCGRQLLGD